MVITKEVVERFRKHFTISSYDECWLWGGDRPIKGYGQLVHNGESCRAHRLSWIIHYGEIPDGMLVCHKCDVRRCVNPLHLFLGTSRDNNIDTVRKGRHHGGGGHGERCGNAKLTNLRVKEIRLSSEPAEIFAERYGVKIDTIRAVRDYKTWKHITV